MKNLTILLLVFILVSSCSKNESKISIIQEKKQDLEMIKVYQEAYVALNLNDNYFAAKKFLEAELLFPQSEWAPKAVLMASYAFYLNNFYADALSNLERFIKTYPNNKDIAYANYLIAMCYYETIEDEKRDLEPLLNAKNKFNYIVKNYPNTDFALDAEFKLEFIEDLLASKEMYIGRHYIKKKKWIPAINRFKTIINDYDRTIFVEEALHRLVELNYRIGLVDESKKYAEILGYNYLSSEWYKKSYKVFNTNYSLEKNKKIKKEKSSVKDKFKKLFE
jgi:outer membrane protein assembly factor BamD